VGKFSTMCGGTKEQEGRRKPSLWWVTYLKHQAINFLIGLSWIVPVIIGEQ